MKRVRNLMLVSMILILTVTNGAAIRMETNGASWFLPDGRIVQTKKVLTDNGSEYPGLLCYNQRGDLFWEHAFRTPAIGRSYCKLTDENIIAFMYHDQKHQFFVEYLDHDGRLVVQNTRGSYTNQGVLYDGGAIFFEN